MVSRKEAQWFVSLVPLIGLDINVSVCQSIQLRLSSPARM